MKNSPLPTFSIPNLEFHSFYEMTSKQNGCLMRSPTLVVNTYFNMECIKISKNKVVCSELVMLNACMNFKEKISYRLHHISSFIKYIVIAVEMCKIIQ